ncbi:MAG TPA: peptidyl-alpha-hydroxyglycine alpha-amidating lyase family protein [Micropepsaceae bacterium]|nr:peptidyl-alpha-hydroxyglycine alpha-amidating lyase family protein [Micropepsaceae bacterium]
MKRILTLLLAGAAFAGVPAIAQTNAPEIPYDADANFLKTPDNVYLGEVGGVAQNSKGDIYVYTRTGHPFVSLGGSRQFMHGGSQLYQFDRNGRFVREVAKDVYGFVFANQVRIDPQDNVWVVDQATNMVMKFDPQGRQVMLLGRKAESINIPTRAAAEGGGGEGGGANAGPPGAGRNQDVFSRPTDVAWDAQGNIFVADGQGNARVAKFDKDGKFIKSWGHKGSGQGEFDQVRSIAVDAQGNVYVADGNNHRIQVFDNNGTFKSQIANLGNPQAICITPGANQSLYVSNSNPPGDIDTAGEIYKMKLDGTMIGKFGKAGRLPKEFGTVNAIDCRNDNNLLVGEIINLRVQKVTLHPAG